MFVTQRNRNGDEFVVDMDDKRFRIRPHQQIMSSCTGALLTSLFSKFPFKPIKSIANLCDDAILCAMNVIMEFGIFSDAIGCGEDSTANPTKADVIE